MQDISKRFILALPLLLVLGCTPNAGNGDASDAQSSAETASLVVPDAVTDNLPSEAALAIGSEEYYTGILFDADGEVCHSARYLLSKNESLVYHYQRVGCNSDTCKQEFVTYSAVQYPQDSILQTWMAGVLADYYYDVTRQLDILVNGQRTEDNGDGELELKNVGCRPYQGILCDAGKSLFDYYQARVWIIGRDRDNVHGPAGRYGCAIYRCWQSSHVASYFVGFSTNDPQWPTHYVCSFDRQDGHRLDLTDVVLPEYIAEFNDLVVEAIRQRHYQLLHAKNCELAIEPEGCDYSSMLDVKAVAFVENGLAVSTGALAFDQWATATHVLIIPYEKINNILVARYRR